MSHQHKLDVIYRSGGEGGMDVVRWCNECGAVVVDHDVDGRVHAGNIMSMRFPSLRGIHLQATPAAPSSVTSAPIDGYQHDSHTAEHIANVLGKPTAPAIGSIGDDAKELDLCAFQNATRNLEWIEGGRYPDKDHDLDGSFVTANITHAKKLATSVLPRLKAAYHVLLNDTRSARRDARSPVAAAPEEMAGDAGAPMSDMEPPSKRQMRERMQERCSHDYRHSGSYGGEICAKCSKIKSAPTASTPPAPGASHMYATPEESPTYAAMAEYAPAPVSAPVVDVLTDEDILNAQSGCSDGYGNLDPIKFARAILAKRAEKGGV